MSQPNRMTAPGREFKGALAGAAMSTIVLAPIWTAIVLSWDEDRPTWPLQGLYDVAVPTCTCLLLLACTAVLGVPLWMWLRRAGRDSWLAAALVGYGTSFFVLFAIFIFEMGLHLRALPGPAVFGLIGALAWSSGWWVAYRKA